MPASTSIGVMLSNPNPYPDGRVLAPRVTTLGASGSTQADAVPIARNIVVLTSASSTVGALLPVPTEGQEIAVVAFTATNTPKVYPPVGGSINGGTVNAAYQITAQRVTRFLALDAVGNYFTN